MRSISNRNHMIDAMKAVAAICVVLVHFPFPGVFGKISSSVGVVGVILFFLISGYQSYCTDASQSGKILRRFGRNLKLTVVAVAIHLLFTVLEHLLAGTLAEWAAANLADPVTYLRMILLGDFCFIHGDHLWYMSAMLTGYLVLYCMEKYRLHSVFYKLLPLLLLLRICMETYTNSFHHFSWLDWHFSGNGLAGALPIMLLGSYIRCKEEHLTVRDGEFYLSRAVCCFLLVFVSVNVRLFGMDISQPFKIAAAVCSFMLCLVIHLKKPAAFLGTVGSRYSLHIYLWHFLIGILLRNILTALGAAQWILNFGLPVLVIALSIALAGALDAVSRRSCSPHGATVN